MGKGEGEKSERERGDCSTKQWLRETGEGEGSLPEVWGQIEGDLQKRLEESEQRCPIARGRLLCLAQRVP